MDICGLNLKPLSWVQTVSNGRNGGRYLAVGQSLLMKCAPVVDSNLQLSDGTRAQGLEVTLSISNSSEPKRGDGTPLETGIGLLLYYLAGRYSTMETHLGGWFCLTPSDFTEVWEQIRNGRYSDCDVTLFVGPVTGDGADWVWQISKDRALFIEEVAISFTHTTAAARRGEPSTAPTERGWLRR